MDFIVALDLSINSSGVCIYDIKNNFYQFYSYTIKNKFLYINPKIKTKEKYQVELESKRFSLQIEMQPEEIDDRPKVKKVKEPDIILKNGKVKKKAKKKAAPLDNLRTFNRILNVSDHLVRKIYSMLPEGCDVEFYIEEYAFGQAGARMSQMCEYGGFVKRGIYLRHNKVPTSLYNSAVKKHITGTGQADKDIINKALRDDPLMGKIYKYIENEFNYKCTNGSFMEDISDAYSMVRFVRETILDKVEA